MDENPYASPKSITGRGYIDRFMDKIADWWYWRFRAPQFFNKHFEFIDVPRGMYHHCTFSHCVFRHPTRLSVGCVIVGNIRIK